MHDAKPLPDHEPTRHEEQFAELTMLNFPGLQATQLVAPAGTPVAEPAVHEIQSSVIAAGAYLPVEQRTQAFEFSTNSPGWHDLQSTFVRSEN